MLKGGGVWWKQKNTFRRRILLRLPHPWRLGVFFVVGVFVVVVVFFFFFTAASFVSVLVFVLFRFDRTLWRLGIVFVSDFVFTAASFASVFVFVFRFPWSWLPWGLVVVSTAPFEVGRCLCFCFPWIWLPRGLSLELVAPRLLCSLGFRPPREAGEASMMQRAPAGVGRIFRSDVGPYVNCRQRYGSTDEGRCCAEASTLFYWNGGGERTLVIYVK